MKYQVYRIVNQINGKFYIGVTSVGLRRRFLQHCNEKFKNTIIKNAIKKYGKQNFIIEEIERCDNEVELYEREIFWIQFYKTNISGYNMLPGGNRGPVMRGKDNHNFGKPPHPNTLEAFRRERGAMSQEHKDSISAGNKGKPKTDEWKAFMSDNMKKLQSNGVTFANSGEKISKTKRLQQLPSHRRVMILCLNNNKVYEHYKEAAKDTGVSAGNIPQVVNGKYAHTKGFKFQRFTAEHLIF